MLKGFNKKISKIQIQKYRNKNILTDKEKHLLNAVDRSIIKLVKD